MNRLLFLLFCFITSPLCMSQGLYTVLNSKADLLNDMITNAINLSCENVVEFREKTGMKPIETFYYCLDGCPNVVNDFNSDSIKYNITWFSFYNFDGLPKWFKNRLKKGLSVNSIYIAIYNSTIEIMVINENIHCERKNHINRDLTIWNEFKYCYDDKTCDWILTEVNFNGL